MDDVETDKRTFACLLEEVQAGYEQHRNPFHNFDHGFNVLHASYFMIKNLNVSKFLAKDEQHMLMVSALIHDIGHTGKTNAFEIASYSKIALRYNDESVLENYHTYYFFSILEKSDCNIFINLQDIAFRKYRKFIISNVLNTDMKKHFELIHKIETKFPDIASEEFVSSESDKLLISGMLIHCCDVCHTTKQFPIA